MNIDPRSRPHPRSGIHLYPHPRPHPYRGREFFPNAGRAPVGAGNPRPIAISRIENATMNTFGCPQLHPLHDMNSSPTFRGNGLGGCYWPSGGGQGRLDYFDRCFFGLGQATGLPFSYHPSYLS